MKAIKTEIPGVVLLEPEVFGDARGYFMERFAQRRFDELVGPVRFVQDNESKSRYGVVRGLHFQKGEYAQAKLVSVVRGRVLDVAVDIRRGSPTFGRHVAALLDGENKRQLFIPRRFAHGFAVLSDEPALAIDWRLPAGEILLSEKDRRHPKLADAPELFEYDRP